MKIEKGLKAPIRVDGYRHTIYPFLQMEVGDSFLVPYNDQNKNKVRLRVNGAWQSMRNYRGLDWVMTMSAKEDGIRVWRIK